MSQVSTCFDSNVQCVGSNRQIHSAHKLSEVGVEEGPLHRNSVPFSTDPGVLLHSKIW